MTEALYILQEEIAAKRAQIRTFDPVNNLSDLVGSSVTLEDLQQEEARLQDKIKQNMALLNRNTEAGETARLLLKNEFQQKLYKCQALLMRLCSKVRQALLAAVPFKRRISRAKKGTISYY